MKSALIIFLLRMFSLVPLPILHKIGNAAGWLSARIPNLHRFRTRVNLEMCLPGLTDEAREELVRQSLQESAKGILEIGTIWLKPLWKVTSLITGTRNIELLSAALEDPRGLILITPHLGNWELLAYYFCRYRKVTAMYKPSGLPDVDKLIQDARARAGMELAPTSFRGVARVRKALKSGEITIILPDQQPELLEGGRFVPFFGVPALSMKLVPSLIKNTDARVLVVYVKRLPAGKGFEIVFHQPSPKVYSEDMDVAIAAVNHSMEKCIKEVPAQYHWEYPRFRRDENGMYIYKELAKRAKH